MTRYIIKIFFWYYKKLRTKFWFKRAEIQSYIYGGYFFYEKDISLDSPLNCNGAGKVVIQKKVSLGFSKAPKIGTGQTLLQARTKESQIFIGEGTHMSNNVSIIACSKITIGANCRIGDLVSIFDSDFHEINPNSRNLSNGKTKEVEIGQNVWIGSRVLILKGVKIGKNCVVAAGSVVTNSVPESSLAAGIPAKVIRKI